MLFNSFVFFVFLGVVLPIFYALPSKKAKNLFLLIASYVFYGYWDWRFCGLLIISTLIDFYIGNKIYFAKSEKSSKRYLQISLFANLSMLGVFKYFNFFVDSFQEVSTQLGWHIDTLHLNVILPVGISFYTFQTLSYSIDIYRKRLVPTNNLIDFGLFVSFFPQLVAGPIERASHLLPQLYENLKPTKLQIEQGIILISLGLFRKVIIGDSAGKYADYLLSDINNCTSDELVFAMLLFTFQVYADFSGYSHIARGTAKLLGVELMKNFEQPYLSQNITELWRRWHISLSSWLKDYVYITLGGNRDGVLRSYLYLMITMSLGGLWHGAGWNFIIWGALHGLYLMIHKFLLKDKKINDRITKVTPRVIFNIIGTNFIFIFALCIFRITPLDNTFLFFKKIYHWEFGENFKTLLLILISYNILVLILDILEYKTKRHTYLMLIKSNYVRYGIVLGILFVTFVYMFQTEPLPFFYFQF